MKRGLLFYIGLLVLLVFGFALVCMVIMLFSPGKSILGLQYFSNSSEQMVKETTDGTHAALDFVNADVYEEIQITTGSAKVRVEHGNAFKETGIVFINNSKGFVKSSDAVDFSYSVSVETTNINGRDRRVLKIAVTEPKAFLHFSNDTQVVVHLADKGTNPFVHTKFNITTDSGNIAFGGNASNAYTQAMDIPAIKIETKSGGVSFNTKINYNESTETQSFTDFNANIGNGSLKISAPTFEVDGRLILESKGGNFDFSTVKNYSTVPATITTESGTIKCKMFDAHLDILCKNGFFYIDEVYGNVTIPEEDNFIDNAYFEFGTIKGDLLVFNAKNSQIKVKRITGNCTVSSTSGSLELGYDGGIGGTAVVKTTGGNISAWLKDGNNQAKEFVSEGGTINLYLDGQILGETLLKTKTGNVNITYTINKSYTFYFTNYSNSDPFDTNRVYFKDFTVSPEKIENPYPYNPSDNMGNINIFTDRDVTLALAR